jgi:8-oxo-dGTP pyrophosphatase MutT (NUDIX family)
VPALRIRLERLGFRAAHAVLRVWWFVRRPHVHGVKAVLRPLDGSDVVLFVRHAYGDRREWQLPGGGLGRGEDAAAAIAREIHEELGLELHELRPLGDVDATGFHKLVTLHCFAARVDARALRVRWGELEEVRWAPPGSPPQPLGKDVPRVVALS